MPQPLWVPTRDMPPLKGVPHHLWVPTLYHANDGRPRECQVCHAVCRRQRVKVLLKAEGLPERVVSMRVWLFRIGGREELLWQMPPCIEK